MDTIWSTVLNTFLILQEAQAYAEENSLLFMETSAKTAMNVNDIFLAIGKSLCHHFYQYVVKLQRMLLN